MPEEQNRSGMLAQVRNPLIFFALALLIIEGIIGLVVTNSQITAAHQFYLGLYYGVPVSRRRLSGRGYHDLVAEQLIRGCGEPERVYQQ